MYRAAFALCGDRATAEDATQEAFARALERWSRLRDVTWVRGWITTTALNVVRRAMRRRSTARNEAHGGPEETEPAGRDDVLDLWRSIRALPRRQQEAVVLHYVADLPVSEVAAAMRCGEGTVKAHLSRARVALGALREVARDE